MRRYAVFGASGFGREVMPLVRSQLQMEVREPWDLVFVDDHPPASALNGHRVLTYQEWLAEPATTRSVAIGVADSRVREKIAQRCEADGVGFIDARAANVVLMDDVRIGTGCILSP